MIPRTLVPKDVRPVSKDEVRKTPRRLTTYMDDRTVVPSGFRTRRRWTANPIFRRTFRSEFSSIARWFRAAWPSSQFERIAARPTGSHSEILDSRIVVPAHIEPLTARRKRKELGTRAGNDRRAARSRSSRTFSSPATRTC